MTGVLFDLDRTLVEFETDVPGLFRRGCERVGVEHDEALFERFRDRYAERFRELDGNPFVAAAAAVVAERDLAVDPDEWAAALIAAERDAAWVHDDVRATVARLARGHPIGVVTQGWSSVQRGKLRAVGLDGHVDAVVTPEQVEAFKPDPALFLAGADRLDADAFVAVGDSVENDVVPAREAGFTTVLYRGDDERADACLAGPGEFDRLPALL